MNNSLINKFKFALFKANSIEGAVILLEYRYGVLINKLLPADYKQWVFAISNWRKHI